MKAGWEIKKLGEVCKTGSGATPLKSRKDFYEGGTVPWLLSGEVSQGAISTASNFITEKALKETAAKLFPENTVLVAMYGATAGQVGILRFPATTNQAVCGILPNERFIPELLFYLFLSKKDELIAKATGNAQPNISQIKIKETPLPIPPLSEQEHIVGILDEAFASIATAKANTQKNLESAKAVFESHLNSVFSNKGEGWVEKKLEDVCEFQNGFAFKSNTFKPSGTPVLRISNIQGGVIDEDDVVFIDPNDYREDLERYRIVKGDLLIAMSGATTGKIGFNTLETEFFLNQRVGKFEPKLPLNKRFLYYYLSTKVEENLRISAGSAQPNLSTEQIKGFLLPIPSMEHQKQLVHDFDVIAEETSRLTSLYTQKLSALDDLKKSLLHQAFTGKL